MERKEFYKLTNKPIAITVDDLDDARSRTLLYGYTCDRCTFHLYLMDEEFFTFIYKENSDHFFKHGGTIDMERTNSTMLVPDKRLYPECCDYDFCNLLQQRGIGLPFTSFNEDRQLSGKSGIREGEGCYSYMYIGKVHRFPNESDS